MRMPIFLALFAAAVVAAAAPATGPFELSRRDIVPAGRLPEGFLGGLRLSPDGRTLLFGLHRPTEEGPTVDYDLWTAALDGSSRNHLALHVLWGLWSPGGKRISYIRSDEGKPGAALRTMRPDGSDDGTRAEPLVKPGPEVPTYRWSPNGEWLAYVVGTTDEDDPSEALWVAAPDGAQKRMLLSSPLPLEFDWAPDGKRLCVWESVPWWVPDERRPQRSAAYLVEFPSGRVTKLASPLKGAFAGECAFSPDGKRLALVCYTWDPKKRSGNPERQDDPTDVSVMLQETATRVWERIWSGRAWEARIRWSPRGDRFAIETIDDNDEGRQHSIALYRDNGEAICRFFQGGDPLWAPTGKRLAYTGQGDQVRDVMVCDNAAGRRTKVADCWPLPGTACWSRDGTALMVVQTPDRPNLLRQAIEWVDVK